MQLLLCSLWHLPLADSLAVLDLVEQFRPAGTVAGFDIAGNDAHPEKRRHYPALRRARDRGIPLTVHAGEAGPSSDVDEMLRLFVPARIGHGVHAASDPDLIGRLATAGTHLEICPSCNVQLGLYPRMAAHPLPVLYERGVSVGISTDQRSVTPTTLTREYERVAQAFPSWGRAEFTACNVNAARVSFAGERTKAAILDRL
jgi:adenosine deaminase